MKDTVHNRAIIAIAAIICIAGVIIWIYKPGDPDIIPTPDNSIQVKADSIQHSIHVVYDNTNAYVDSLKAVVTTFQKQISKTNHNTHESLKNIYHTINIDSLDRFLSGQYDSLARTRFAAYTQADSSSGAINNVWSR